jgi:hypothetical protein
MSAVLLRLIDASEVHTAKDAEAFLAGERGKPPATNPKFAAFRQTITQIYPDLSGEDEDGDNDENIWEEGLSGQASSGNFATIAVKIDLVDAAMLVAIARAAIDCGLQCYDDEGQILYRADGQAIDMRGKTRAL